MNKYSLKDLGRDVLIDMAAGVLIGIGVYNFAANASFPLAGVTGIALVFYHLFGIPIGWMTMLLNVPIAIGCFRGLGKEFFLRSIKTVIITSLFTDYIAPLFPVYSGDRMLAAICTGLFSGLGYAILFMNNTSTGGMDFISLNVRKKYPHLTLGRIVFIFDTIIVLAGGLIIGDVDGTIYGLIITYMLSVIIDKIMYGIDEGKVALIITDKGKEIAEQIGKISDRGSTLLKGEGSYSGKEKEIVMCACNTKQMYVIKKLAKQIDEKSFTVVMEANEVVGEGFKQE